ncbi:DNA helicase rad5 [Elasticomyces elasticus]|nr:DNA helicase rad5 [Elasticomyces elasticus]
MGDERDLRLRQIGLVKLFSEINLHPSKVNETTARHKREGILQAAEVAEVYDHQPPEKKSAKGENSSGSRTPSGEDPAEEGEEVEQDQLDSLYKKTQTFDFNTPNNNPLLRSAWTFETMCLGRVLADEMGLGKTIEMLSLIHSHTSPEQDAGVAAALEGGGMESVNNLPRLAKGSANVERAAATTLVVASMSLLAQWASEAEKASVGGSLTVLVYYGSEKNINLQTLCSESNASTAPNVIITSYGTVLSEFNGVAALHGERGSHGGLFSIEYWRIILDEARMIKNRSSKTAKACYELAATHRWVLTGMPIVNRLEDLFSLVRFLRVEPWANFSFWKTFITAPFEKGGFDMETPDGEALVPLPAKRVDIERLQFSDPNREVYKLYDHPRSDLEAEAVATAELEKGSKAFEAARRPTKREVCRLESENKKLDEALQVAKVELLPVKGDLRVSRRYAQHNLIGMMKLRKELMAAHGSNVELQTELDRVNTGWQTDREKLFEYHTERATMNRLLFLAENKVKVGQAFEEMMRKDLKAQRKITAKLEQKLCDSVETGE